MPRRDFIQDLEEISNEKIFPHFKNVKRGEDDGVVCFTYLPDQFSGEPIHIELLVSGMAHVHGP